MKSKLVAVSLVMLLLCSGCGGDSPEKVADEAMVHMEEVVSVLKGVKDEASAAAAKDKIRALNQKWKALEAREKAIRISKSKEMELKAKYQPQMEDITKRLTKEAERIAQNPKLAPVLLELQGMR